MGCAPQGFDLIWTTGRTPSARRKFFSAEDNLSKDSRGDVQAIAVGQRGHSGRHLRIVNAHP